MYYITNMSGDGAVAEPKMYSTDVNIGSKETHRCVKFNLKSVQGEKIKLNVYLKIQSCDWKTVWMVHRNGTVVSKSYQASDPQRIWFQIIKNENDQGGYMITHNNITLGLNAFGNLVEKKEVPLPVLFERCHPALLDSGNETVLTTLKYYITKMSGGGAVAESESYLWVVHHASKELAQCVQFSNSDDVQGEEIKLNVNLKIHSFDGDVWMVREDGVVTVIIDPNSQTQGIWFQVVKNEDDQGGYMITHDSIPLGFDEHGKLVQNQQNPLRVLFELDRSDN